MKNKELKITKQMLYDGRHRGYNVYGIKRGYCNLHDCCDMCNPQVRLGCKIIKKIEDWQTRIINKLVVD